MSEILRKWLGTRLGLIIDYNLQSFEEIAQDGFLIAQILYSYGIINNENLNKITKTYDIETVLSNLAYLRYWLVSIGINCTDKSMYDIAHKEKSAAVRLFYQLYVILNTKSKVNSLIQKNIDEQLITKPIEKPVFKPYNACEINELSVSPYVADTRNTIKWHRDKYMNLMKKCQQVREEYMINLENKLLKTKEFKRTNILGPPEPKNQILLSYEREKRLKRFILTKPDISLLADKEGHCIEDVKKGKKYITYLKQKQQKLVAHTKLENQVHKLLFTDLVNMLVEKEDYEFKELISSKLLRQSSYEKQMAVKLIEVRHQKHIMLETLQKENKMVVKQKEQEFIEQLFQQHSNLTFKEKQYLENKKRQFELHKRLWDKKCALKHKQNCKICKDVFNDLVDLALRYVEYHENFKLDVPKNIWREWTALFCTALPIFPVIEDVIQVLEEPEEFDEPLTIELYRQNGLDESDFLDYINIYSVWSIDSMQPFYDENREKIELGSLILGFVIHRLLLLKYPYPEAPVKPILPPTDYRACILGLENYEILPILQKALIRKEVIVLEMPIIINYCLDAYLSESTDDTDVKLKEETKKGGKSKDKLVPKGKKVSKKGFSLTAIESKRMQPPFEQVTQSIQTPKLFPGEEMILSKKAELGKYAYETLHLGLEINENLMTAMLLEFLKELKHVKGWVLINFPESLNEAYMLEEAFNGKSIPDLYKTSQDNIVEDINFEKRDEIFTMSSDRYALIRQSKLLSDPKPPCLDKYETFFTSFILMKFQSSEHETSEYETEPYKNNLLDFYTKLSVNNAFNYKKFDISMVKDLVQYVLKDEVFAINIYEELILSAVNSATERKKKKEDSSINELDKSKKSNKLIKSESKKLGKTAKENVKSIQSLIEKSNIELEEVLEPPKPGEANWEYIILPLPRDMSRLLATTWQYIEDIYINDFKQLFFMKRVYQNQIMPYVHEIDTYMQNYIERPDKKQEYLHDFQTIYNEIDIDIREDEEFKAELHFRLLEFRDKLWLICDTRMKECEEERQRIISENWFTNHSTNFTNIFVKAAQLELDRCVSSLQLLQDYYSCMAAKKPLETKLPRYLISPLEIVQWSDTDVKKSSGSNYDKTPDIVANMLTDIAITTDNSPFITFLHSMYQTLETQLNTWELNCLSGIKTIESSFVLKPSKVIKPTKIKEVVSITAEDIMISEKVEKMILEWNSAIKGELLRTEFRLKLILEKSIGDINDNLYHAEQLFHEIYNRIQDRYTEEVESVDNICQIFARAIEACEPIQVRLILDGAKFHVDQNMLFSPDNAFTYKTVKERFGNFELSIAQLNLLVNIFLSLAPSGSMPERCFIFLFEDMVSLNHEDCTISPLPLHWHNLKTDDVKKLVRELYGTSEYIDWKDFIIWNLLLPYPTECELLEVRRQFREMDTDKLEFVNAQQFSCVQFWFEEEFSTEQEVLRMNLIKDLLCKMFKISKDNINYTALLLYFCKDIDSIRGVSKAFELSIGQLVCWDLEVGVKFVELMRYQKKLEDQRKDEVLSVVHSVVDSIFENTLKTFGSSTTFLDIDSDEQSVLASEKTVVVDSCTCLFDEHVIEEEIGGSSELPAICYFLSFAVVLKVMVASFPWHSLVPCLADKSVREQLEDIYDSCKHEEFDNKVFMHEFLNNQKFVDLINRNSKFLERLPPDLVRSYVEVCTCE